MTKSVSYIDQMSGTQSLEVLDPIGQDSFTY